MTLRFREIVLLLLATTIFGWGWFLVDSLHSQWQEQRLRANVHSVLMDKSALIGNALNTRISLLYALRHFVEANPDPTRLAREFDHIASSMQRNNPVIRAAQLVENGKITYLWPMAHNDKILGHNLYEDPRISVRTTVHRAMKTDSVVLNGPMELRQGGMGIVARLRVHRPDGSIWGLAAVVMDMPTLLASAGMREKENELRFAMTSTDGSVFHGDASVLGQSPEIQRITFAGETWSLAAVPQQGWGDVVARQSVAFRYASGTILGLLFIVLVLLLRSRHILRVLVEQRTRELREANSHLRKEMDVRLRAEGELTTALQRAEQSEQLKDTFIATMSHEIRTPLHVMLGYANLLTSYGGCTVYEQDSYIEHIRLAGQRLLRTVEEILQFSALKTGTFTLRSTSVDLCHLTRTMVANYSAEAATKGLNVTLDIPDQPLLIQADPYCIEQSVGNLLDNAIKYTAEGSVGVEVAAHDGVVRLTVRDTGIGISEPYLESVFEAFSQEVHGYARPYEGLGLGLALTRHYVEFNGGSITVESTKGVGSKFHVCFPQHRQSSVASSKTAAHDAVLASSSKA